MRQRNGRRRGVAWGGVGIEVGLEVKERRGCGYGAEEMGGEGRARMAWDGVVWAGR